MGALKKSGSREVISDVQAYVREVNETPLLTIEEERELGWAIINENCPASRERMIRSNLRLVISIARNYANRGLPMTDLIEEGNIGLMRAVEGFDPAQGARFSTYASWWIKQAMKRALINAMQPVHVPGYMVELIAKWKEASRKLEAELGVPPTLQQLADHMQLPLRKVRIIKRAIKAFQSLSSTGAAGDSDLRSLGEMIADERAGQPTDRMFRQDEVDTLRKLLDAIDEREAEILRLRFGLDGQTPLTLKEISDAVGLSRERVRQVVDEALVKLNEQLSDDMPSRFFRENRTRQGDPMPLAHARAVTTRRHRGSRLGR